jgi:hypothetical protein
MPTGHSLQTMSRPPYFYHPFLMLAIWFERQRSVKLHLTSTRKILNYMSL